MIGRQPQAVLGAHVDVAEGVSVQQFDAVFGLRSRVGGARSVRPRRRQVPAPERQRSDGLELVKLVVEGGERMSVVQLRERVASLGQRVGQPAGEGAELLLGQELRALRRPRPRVEEVERVDVVATESQRELRQPRRLLAVQLHIEEVAVGLVRHARNQVIRCGHVDQIAVGQQPEVPRALGDVLVDDPVHELVVPPGRRLERDPVGQGQARRRAGLQVAPRRCLVVGNAASRQDGEPVRDVPGVLRVGRQPRRRLRLVQDRGAVVPHVAVLGTGRAEPRAEVDAVIR